MLCFCEDVLRRRSAVSLFRLANRAWRELVRIAVRVGRGPVELVVRSDFVLVNA